MTLYQFLRENESQVSAMVKAGIIPPKYLIWRDMYEYIASKMVLKKRYRKSKSEIVNQTAKTFRTSSKTVWRAYYKMKQQVNYATAKQH